MRVRGVVQADPGSDIRASELLDCQTVLLQQVQSWLTPKQRQLARLDAGEARIEPGRGFRIHLTRETEYGDRYKLYLLTAPATPGAPPYGLKLEREDDGRFAVSDLVFNGLAEKAGIKFGDYVDEIDVEQLGRPAREWVYPFAFALLGIIVALQLARRGRENEQTENLNVQRDTAGD